MDFPPPATQNDPDILCVANGTYVLALAACGLPDQIPEALDRMRERFEEIDHDLSRVSALANVACAGYLLFDPGFCRDAADEALKGRGILSSDLVLERLVMGLAAR